MSKEYKTYRDKMDKNLLVSYAKLLYEKFHDVKFLKGCLYALHDDAETNEMISFLVAHPNAGKTDILEHEALVTCKIIKSPRDRAGENHEDTRMNKVIIIGCPGSGKSTFARDLRDITGLPLYYLDMYWYRSDKSNVSTKEFDSYIQKIVKSDRWIIDGTYQRTLQMRMMEADTIFLLDYPLDVCMSGVESRIGTEHEDLPWIETEFSEDFKKGIIDFHETQLPEIYCLIKKYQQTKQIIIFKSRSDADNFLQKLSDG
jgi:adenylate kinase family enzyme